MSKSVKSEVWNFFVKTLNGGDCKLCQKNVKSSGNTSNLYSHIKHHHPDVLIITSEKTSLKRKKSELEDFDADSSTRSDETFNAQCVKSSNEKLQDHVPKSKNVLQNSSVQKSPILSSKNLHRVDQAFTFQRSWHENGTKHAGATNRLLFMIAKDKMSYSHVEKEGFKRFVSYLCPLYKIPSGDTVTRLMENKYDVLSEICKEELSSIPNLAITTDIWTDTQTNKSFIGVTCHYSIGTEFKTLVIGVTPLSESHTAENIEKWLHDIFKNWRIKEESTVVIVSDNAANIVKAITSGFGEEKHIPCFAHTLNLVPSKLLSEDVLISPIQKKVKAIVTYFHKSVSASDELRKTSQLRLIQSVETRWNSSYDMHRRFVEMSSAIAPILLQKQNAPEMLTASDLSIVKEFVKLLEPFKVATDMISGQSYETGSKVIPIVKNLKLSVETCKVTTSDGTRLKDCLMKEFNKRFKKIENMKIFALSTLLDPTFKRLHFDNKIACANAINYIIKLINNEILSLKSKVENNANLNNMAKVSATETNFWSRHLQLVEEKQSNQPETSDMPEEFRYYLNSELLAIDKNPLEFWAKYHDSPLAKIAKRFLTVIATSVPSERLFSQAALILTEKRSRMSAEHLQQLLFLSSLEYKDWFID